jgi:BirA family biotin operon repressor/biotin-[acetyl-CoA-carboxylase] ligase
MNIHIIKVETTDSTNSEAMRHARSGAEEGLCVLARHQSAGRGRQGRVWVSEADSGLYFSMILRPKLAIHRLPLITLMAGVAAYEALAGFSLKPDIKWVNDILVSQKKIAGILAETVDTPSGLAVIVGIGINLSSENLPVELARTATSIEQEAGCRVSPDEATQALTFHLSHHYSRLTDDNERYIIDQWQERSTYYSGKSVRVTLSGGFIDGLTDGLEDNGALRVRSNDGSLHIVQAGDVEQLRQV